MAYNKNESLDQNSETPFSQEECCEGLAKIVNKYFDPLSRNQCPKNKS